MNVSGTFQPIFQAIWSFTFVENYLVNDYRLWLKEKKRKKEKIVHCNISTSRTKFIFLQTFIKVKSCQEGKRSAFFCYFFPSVTCILISAWPFFIRCLNGSCYGYSIAFDPKLLRTIVCFAKVMFLICLWMCSKGLPTKYTRLSLRINYLTALKLNVSQETYREYF